jgi:periplasmic divalent cation tolerance protein
MTDVILVLTTAPEEEAERLARTLVDQRLAACVNVYAPMQSIYRWKGAVEIDTEQQIVIKTTAERLPALVARLTALHSYEVPELLVVPVTTGSDAYIAWVRQETADGKDAKD